MKIETITKVQIDEVVKNLPPYYIDELSRMIYGRATQANKRRIKHWRSGKMANEFEKKRIMLSAKQLVKNYQKEMAKQMAKLTA